VKLGAKKREGEVNGRQKEGEAKGGRRVTRPVSLNYKIAKGETGEGQGVSF